MDWKQKKLNKYTILFFFSALMALGTYFSSDYGISRDEAIELRNGIYSFCSALHYFTGNSFGVDLSSWGDRYYGNGLQHIFLFADYICGCFCVSLHGNTTVWLVRHWLTFVFMLTGLFFMYQTGLLLFRNKLKALLPVILFLFMPRFVAESFYNAKDMGMLSGMMIGGYFMVRYALRPTCLNAVYFGTAAAFACSIRLVGLQFIPAGLFIAIFMDALCKGEWSYKKIIRQLLCFTLSFAIFATVFYPASWYCGPVTFFSEAISYMSSHPWQGTVRFCGKDYISGTTPWYYLIVWIGITTPLPILFLLFSGSVCIIKKCFSLPFEFFRRRSTLILLAFFMMFWAELAIMPLIVKNYYNGWRQFYFLGYPMLMIAACGMINLFNAAKKHRFLQIISAAAIIAAAGIHVTWMATQHPYQFLYFNILPQNPQRDFELDYWYVSNVDGIRKLLDRNQSGYEEKTLAYNENMYPSLAMIGEEKSKNLSIVSRRGFHDYIIIMNDNDGLNREYVNPLQTTVSPKIISDETIWVKNSLGTKRVMLCRIIEFERTPNAQTLPVQDENTAE